MVSVEMLLLAVISLFGFVAAHFAPTNLTAEIHINVKENDYADVDLKWVDGLCPVKTCYIYAYSGSDEKQQIGSTAETKFTVKKLEFWTNYTFEVEPSAWCLGDTLRSNIHLGPGNPHKIKDMNVTVEATSAVVTIDEAPMPRAVDAYLISYCSNIAGCVNNTMQRDNSAQVPTQTFNLSNLVPSTLYSMNVTAQINLDNHTFLSQPYSSNFATTDMSVPLPSNFQKNITEDNSVISATVEWTLEKSNFVLAYFNLTLKSKDGKMLANLTTPQPKASFTNLPFHAELELTVGPVYNVSNHLITTKSVVFELSTPEIAPKNFRYANISTTEVFVGWDAPANITGHNFTYKLQYCLHEDCAEVSVDGSARAGLKNLRPNSTYHVIVTATLASKLLMKSSLNESFVTLAQDYSPPQNFSTSLAGNTTDGVLFELQWSQLEINRRPSMFELVSCNLEKKCLTNQTNKTEFELPVVFFETYNVNITSVYSVELNQVVRRTNSWTVETPGTVPESVDRVTLVNVSDSAAVIEWQAPVNVPSYVQRMYTLNDDQNNITVTSETESVEITDLKPDRAYNFSIEVQIFHQNDTFTSSLKYIQFASSPGNPGPIGNLEAVQQYHNNVVDVSWLPPNVTNGDLDFYEVRAIFGQNVTATELVYGSTSAAVLFRFMTTNDYIISVRAVNVDNNNRTLYGPETNTTLKFIGPVEPALEIVGRSSSSLSIQITPDKNATNDTNLYFRVHIEGSDEDLFSNSTTAVLDGLTAYSSYKLYAYACFHKDFCSLPVTIDGETNVGVSDEVQSLEIGYTNQTNPELKWQFPMKPRGPIDGYLVTVLNLDQDGPEENFTVLGAAELEFVYNATDEFETFNLTIRAFSYDLDQPEVMVLGKPVTGSVSTSGFSVPKPVNLHEDEMNTTSLRLTWEVPHEEAYNVTWFLVNIPMKNSQEFTQNTSLDFTQLAPYTHLTVQISGCTERSADKCGHPRTFVAETDADVPSEPTSFTVVDIEANSALVQWQNPKTPNGPISGFQLALSSNQESANMTWLVFSGGQLNYTVMNLTESTEYTVHLLAYNVNHENERLVSKTLTRTFTTGESSTFPYWLVGLLIVVALTASLAGAMVYKRNYSNRNASDDTQILTQHEEEDV